jgi:hypothetical protein
MISFAGMTFQWQTLCGGQVTVGDVNLTPESRALIVRWPQGGLVWVRPVALVVERGEEQERVLIADVTRELQLGLLGLAIIAAMLALAIPVLVIRRRRD